MYIYMYVSTYIYVHSFDADGDGVVTLNEFLSFTGPKRDKHSGALQAMGAAKCCWLTTCRITVYIIYIYILDICFYV
jgi:hypothetical protein